MRRERRVWSTSGEGLTTVNLGSPYGMAVVLICLLSAVCLLRREKMCLFVWIKRELNNVGECQMEQGRQDCSMARRIVY